MSPELRNARRLLSIIGKHLPGEHYGKKISTTDLDLSPVYIYRDLKALLGTEDSNYIIRAKLFPAIVWPWDNTPIGKWTDISLHDAVEAFCGEDIPRYISGTDNRHASGVRIIQLEAGNLTGPVRLKESRKPYSKLLIMLNSAVETVPQH